MNDRYFQSRDSFNLEALKSHCRDESEQTWLDGFMQQAQEIDIELKQLKKESDHGFTEICRK